MRRPKARSSRRPAVPTNPLFQRDSDRPLQDTTGPSSSTQSPVRRVRSRVRQTNASPETDVHPYAIPARTSRVYQPVMTTTLSISRRHQLNRSMSSSHSSVWSSLPLKIRIISILAGFMIVYYVVFGKHHYYDREISSIHSDVEQLMRHVNRSSVFQQNVVEAELPEIFREEPDSKTSPTPSPSILLKEKSMSAPKKKRLSKKKSEGADDKQSAPKSGSASEGASETQKKKSVSDAKPAAGTQLPGDNKSTTLSNDPATTTPKDIIASAASQLTESNSTSEGSSAAEGSEPHPTTSKDSPESNATSSKSKDLDVPPTDSSPQTSGTGTAANNDVSQDPSSRSSPSDHADKRKGDLLGPESPPGVGEPDAAVADVSGELKQSSASSAVGESETHNYEKEFRDLDGEDVPEGHVPVLTWNYKSVLDPEVKEQIFGLGDRLDHVAMYKPLCLDTNTGGAFSFRGEPICSGFNRTYGWLVQYCSVMKETMRKEYLLEVRKDGEEIGWLGENNASIKWVEGLTVLQVLEKNCGNIAHYSGRILLLEHIINNIQAYAAPPSNIENILIIPTFHIMKRFVHPHNYEFWHKTMMNALLTPGSYEIGTLGDFILRNGKSRENKLPVVQLLHNFSVNANGESQKQYVCFRRALVPGYLKARFFINDEEYPSTNPSLQSKAEAAPSVPRDSLRMREKVSTLLNRSPRIPERRKEIVLLDRGGSRRVFGGEAKEEVISMLTRVAADEGYSFNVTSFDKMQFKNQYDIMKTVSIAVGIHGANLVNSMFMPPLSVLIELFPFGFKHEMYMNGGNAGLKYFSYQMSSGEQFKGPKVYRSVEQCIKYSQECKVHYRDAALQVDATDLAEMERVLREGIAWCDSLGGT